MNIRKGVAALLALLLALPAWGMATTSGNRPAINRSIASNNARSLANLPETARGRTDTLVIGVPDLYGETNPFWVKTMGDHYLASLLYDELLFQSNSGEMGAGVAAFEVSQDRHTVAFTVQSGVCYADDGEPVTSDDFINALYLLLTPGYDGVYDIARASIRGVEAYLSGEADAIVGVARLSDRAFSVTLDVPNPEKLIFLAIPALRVSLFGDMRRPETLTEPEDFPAFYEETLERVRSADAAAMAYGQYCFMSMEPGEKATLAAHEAYWRGKPNIGGVELLVIPTDPSIALMSMLEGTVDIISVLGSVDLVSDAFDTGFINLYTWEGDVLGYLGMDIESALFSDPSIREALAIGIDRAELERRTLERYAVLPTALVFDSFGLDTDILTEAYPYDPDRAADLLESAGWAIEEDGMRHRNGLLFSFTLTYNTPNPFMDKAAYRIQEDYAALGIEAELRAVPLEELIELVEAGACDMYFQARKLPSSAALSADLFVGDSRLNASGYTSDVLTRDLTRATEEADPARQTVLYEGLFLELYAELPIIPLYRRSEMLLVSGRILNAVVTTAHDITSDVYRFFLVDSLEKRW